MLITAASNTSFLLALPPELFLLVTNHLAPEDLASLLVSSPVLAHTYAPLLRTYITETSETLLTGAVLLGFHSLASILLRHGFSPSPTDTINGMTPLHHACLLGDLASTNLLIAYEAPLSVLSTDGCTPLHLAAAVGHTHLIEPLINAGADPDAANDAGATPLYYSASRGKTDATQKLLELGADFSISDEEGWTPLHCASVKGFDTIATALLSAGMQPGTRDNALLSPLHYACIRGHIRTARVLLEGGADVNATDGTGLSAICGAASAGHEEVVGLLLGAGAIMGLGDAVLSAAAQGRVGVVNILMRLGGDAVRIQGRDVLKIAVIKRHCDVVDAMLTAGVQVDGELAKDGLLLRLAVEYGWAGVVRKLLESGEFGDVAAEMVLEQPLYRGC